MKESLDVDKDAFSVIASRADGSLRDAEMILDQLSLLDKTISSDMVRELVSFVRRLLLPTCGFKKLVIYVYIDHQQAVHLCISYVLD